MKKTILAVVIPSLFMAASGISYAAEMYNKDGNKVDVYGKVQGEHEFVSGEGNTNTDNTYARLGIKGETQINDVLTGFGQWEYQANANAPEGSQTTKTRLAFAGLKFGDFGSLDYGRNYAALHDVEAFTDVFIGYGGDSWTSTDNYMTGRNNNVLSYRNTDFFGLVDGLNMTLSYQGKNDRDYKTSNGDGVSLAATYDTGIGVSLASGYSNSNRSVKQKVDGNGDKAEAWAVATKYDANDIYAALMYSETRNMTMLNGIEKVGTSFAATDKDKAPNAIETQNGLVADKTKNLEAVVQYNFDFGLTPSIGYVSSKVNGHQAKEYVELGSQYNFNKNMKVYLAYQINMMSDSDAYAKAVTFAGGKVDTADRVLTGITYQF